MIKGSIYQESFDYNGLKVMLEHDMSVFSRLLVFKGGSLIYQEQISVPCWTYFRYKHKLQRQLDQLTQMKVSVV